MVQTMLHFAGAWYEGVDQLWHPFPNPSPDPFARASTARVLSVASLPHGFFSPTLHSLGLWMSQLCRHPESSPRLFLPRPPPVVVITVDLFDLRGSARPPSQLTSSLTVAFGRKRAALPHHACHSSSPRLYLRQDTVLPSSRIQASTVD